MTTDRAPYNGPQSLEEWARWAKGRTERDNDAITIISGETGSGKSSLALLMARKLNPGTFVPRKQILWNVEGLLEMAREMGDGAVLLVDEAIVAGGNRRRAMSNDNIQVMDHLNTCRAFHQLVFFLAPNFGDMDISLQQRVKWHLHVPERGVVEGWEVMKAGGPMGRSVYQTKRFTDRFPDPRKVAPELWEHYEKAKMDYSFHGADPAEILKKTTVKKMMETIAELDDGARVN